MSSKLLPRSEIIDGNARSFVYRSLNDTARGPVVDQRAPAPSKPPDEVVLERDGLRLRVAELEQALAQQVPATRAQALREGEATGRAQADAVTRPVIDRMNRSIQDLIELKPRIRKELEEEAVQLSLAISRRILRRELSLDPSSLQGLIQVAFDRVSRQEITRILVHPDQEASIRAALAQFTTRKIDICADAARETGTVIFETTRGSLDASIDTQLKEIELGLADRLKWR